jgi:hypothetical protein
MGSSILLRLGYQARSGGNNAEDYGRRNPDRTLTAGESLANNSKQREQQ